MLTSTYTYVTLPVSEETYYEIYDKLTEAGYGHCFHGDGKESPLIDMHGLALEKKIK
jgi:hypothetical protein